MHRVLSFPPQSEGYGGPDAIVTKRLCIASMFSMGLITLITGFLLGRYALVRERLQMLQPLCYEDHTYLDETVGGTFILQAVNTSNIHGYLESLNSPHSGNVSDNLWQAQQMQQHFRDRGLDSVSAILPSQILLSYFQDDLNKVEVFDGKGEKIYESTPLHFQVPQKTDTFKVTNITMKGSVVYVDYGRESDFRYLETQMNIAVKDTIVLARIGKVLPVDLVDQTLKRGAKGVILITDGASEAYKFLLLPSQLGMLQVMHGNPALASSQALGRLGEDFGCVPVQIVTETVADQIFNHMFPEVAQPVNWKVNLTAFYHVDPDFTTHYHQLRMTVYMVNMEQVLYNVIGAIRGSHEPDRYVLVANNRQSLLGGDDSLGGAASMMELVRVLADLKRLKGWRPRRSVVFCSWGLAQGDQHMTTTPLPEEWGHGLESRALAYLSVEAAVSGGGDFSARVTPLLTTVLFESAALVPNPRREEIAKGRRTLYDNWLNTSRSTPDHKPFVNIVRGVGDLRTIVHNHGIPTLDFHYANAESGPRQSSTDKDYQDVNHTHHCAVTQLWGVLLWKLSDSVVIPFDVVQYSTLLTHSVATISTKYRQTIAKHTLPLDKLSDAVSHFTNAASEFQKRMKSIDQSNILEVRILNDQLLHVERSFLHHTAIDKTNTAFRHVVLSPGKYLDNDPTSGFGVLQDLLTDLTSDRASSRADVISHLSVLVHCVTSATFALQGSLEPLALVNL